MVRQILGCFRQKSHQWAWLLTKRMAKPLSPVRLLTFSDDSHQWSKRAWQCGSPALTHTEERGVPDPHDSYYTRERERDGQVIILGNIWFSFKPFSFIAFLTIHAFFLDKQVFLKKAFCWRLTLTNRLQRCAADTGKCTGADEKSPPEKQTKAFICTP